MPDGSGDAMDTSVARDASGRAADHAGIERLADELLPALMAKLTSTRLGELEVHEGEWRVRLRRPAGEGVNYGRRSTDRASRSQPGHEGHGHAPGAVESHARHAGVGGLLPVGPGHADPASNGHAGQGAHPGHVDGHTTRGGHTTRASAGEDGFDGDARLIATSPAVGVFMPGPAAVSGTKVRAGDRLGIVDMLGVPQEVLAPADGIVGGTLVEGGTAVEYGQQLVRLELPSAAEAG